MPRTIDFYFWPFPDAWSVAIALEEMGLPYKMIPVDDPDGTLATQPLNGVPSVTDWEGPDGAPVTLSQAGSILLYLADKSERFGGRTAAETATIADWVHWQARHLAPTAEEARHFLREALSGNPPQFLPYAQKRYARRMETCRRLLDAQLAHSEFLAARYSVADMAIWPAMEHWAGLGRATTETPFLDRWRRRVGERAATDRGFHLGRALLGASRPLDRLAR